MARSPRRLHPWQNLPCEPLRLLDLLRAVLHDERDEAERLLAEFADVPALIETMAGRHRLGAFLWHRWSGTAVWSKLPQVSQARLEQSVQWQLGAVERSRKLLAEMSTRLADMQVPFLVLKGLELASRYYQAPSARGYRDLDLLIHERDRARVMLALEASHWHRLSRVWISASWSARFNHAFDFRRREDLIDLHWAVSRLPGIRVTNDALFGRAETLRIDDVDYRVLGHSDELALLLLSSFADMQRGALRLQSFIDIAMVMRGMDQAAWDLFLITRREERTAAICEQVARVVMLLLGRADRGSAPIPSLVEHGDREQSLAILLPSAGGYRGKMWAMKHLPINPVSYGLWWTASLPFRAMASHPSLQRRPAASPAT